MAFSVKAQIFIQDDEMTARSSSNAEAPLIPNAGGYEYDQTNYTPIGSGLLLLTALGGVYALTKKKENK